MRYYRMLATMKAQKNTQETYSERQDEERAFLDMIQTRTDRYNACFGRKREVNGATMKEVFFVCVAHYSESVGEHKIVLAMGICDYDTNRENPDMIRENLDDDDESEGFCINHLDATCGWSIPSDQMIREEFRNFWNSLDLKGNLDNDSLKEIGIQNLRNLRSRSRYCLNEEDFDIEWAGRGSDSFGEWIPGHTMDEATGKAFVKGTHDEEYSAEIARITATRADIFQGHPVHYIIEENVSDKAREKNSYLVATMVRAGRFTSGRIISLGTAFFERNMFQSQDQAEKLARLYNNIAGGSVLVDVKFMGEHSEFSREDLRMIEFVCEEARKHRFEVLTIFRIPRGCIPAREAISANLNNELSMVTFREAAMDRKAACKEMKDLCMKKKVADQKRFVNAIPKDQDTFYLEDIDRLFRSAYTSWLKEVKFPAYKECESSAVKSGKMKGTAAESFDHMIGLKDARKVIDESVGYFKIQREMEKRGLATSTPARSMLFTGNPGTAKTTVARLVAQIFRDNEILPRGELIEVGRADLVGRFVGWTAPLVKRAFMRAKGGVLFIDEAYSLVDDKDGLYGDEAINTIVQEMENHREDTVVIFAGYPDKMKGFLDKNPGLRSRIAFHVDFPDYNEEELLAIFKKMLKDQAFTCDVQAEERALEIFREAVKLPDFGNGRYVRNMVEQSMMQLSLRLAEGNVSNLTDSALTTLTAADLAAPGIFVDGKEPKKRIGFVA